MSIWKMLQVKLYHDLFIYLFIIKQESYESMLSKEEHFFPLTISPIRLLYWIFKLVATLSTCIWMTCLVHRLDTTSAVINVLNE